MMLVISQNPSSDRYSLTATLAYPGPISRPDDKPYLISCITLAVISNLSTLKGAASF